MIRVVREWLARRRKQKLIAELANLAALAEADDRYRLASAAKRLAASMKRESPDVDGQPGGG